MTIHTTTNYGIAYADTDTALGDYPTVTQQVANTLDAALGRGGIAPPDATTQAQLAARATALESFEADRLERDWRKARLNLAAAITYTAASSDQLLGQGAGAWTLEYDAGPAGSANAMFATANQGRLTVRKAGWYRARMLLAISGGTNGAHAVGRLAKTTSPTTAVRSNSILIYSGESYLEVVANGISMAVGDYISPVLWSDTAANFTIQTVLGGATKTQLELEYLGAVPTTPTS